MRRSSSHSRAQAEPTVTLAAVLAIVFGVTAYALVLVDAVPSSERDIAGPTLVRVHDQLTEGGVAAPSRLADALNVGPSGYEMNVSLITDDTKWSAGPTPPESADRASTRVGVRLRPGVVRSATLTVEVWS